MVERQSISLEPPSSEVLRLRHLNALHATTQNLPAETLSKIFQMSMEPLTVIEEEECWDLDRPKWSESYPYPLVQVLGAVSFHWRQIVWTTPRLWYDISISFRKSFGTGSRAYILKLFLENSGALPLSLYLFYKNFDDTDIGGTLVHESVDELLFGAIQRIARLSLMHSPSTPTWITHINKFVNLKELTLHLCPMHSNIHIPSLSDIALVSVDFEGISSSKIMLSYYSMTSLSLRNLTKAACAGLLFQCINLEHFVMNEPDEVTDIEGPSGTAGSKIVLPHLRGLHWDCGYEGTGWDSLVLRYIHTPSLQKFRWAVVTDDDWPEWDNLFKYFCQRLPSCLLSFVVRTNNRFSRPLHHLPKDLPLLETIGLSSPSVTGPIATLLESNNSSDSSSKSLYPKLKALFIEGHSFQEYTVNFADSLQVMIVLAMRVLALDSMLTVHLLGISLDWNTDLYPGPLLGFQGLKLVIRGGEENNPGIPAWFQHLLPGSMALAQSRSSSKEMAYRIGLLRDPS
ncbi:hypothetical protein NP233_g9191 [Leucocoprinus birnbaumii]|uniref:F-box domain-containing protein n=1 Tax=Leucocoprinus birnbaumii TaxID=56174 RepID=A0AAD5YT26_9AGAR|nr:hypothetical protein NP233_g9191 [Leucocoprinus birnbaumii]